MSIRIFRRPGKKGRANIQETIPKEMYDSAMRILEKKRVAIFLVSYNAEEFLESVIDRIDKEILKKCADLFIIDDSSRDGTFDIAKSIEEDHPQYPIHVFQTPFNRGYGGNQKLGYLYCIKQNYDIVILLHGDGQYPPEYIPNIIASFEDEPDAVFASRMIKKKWALQGGMPLYKWIGNQILTFIENRLLKTRLSEFHTGYRAYRVESLKKIPFIFNSDDFHFDTEIIIQAVAMGWKINEIPIPTHYGTEKCHVSGMRYAWNCVKSIIIYKLNNLGLFYSRNYDFQLFENEKYQFKKSPRSLHQYIIKNVKLTSNMNTIELGANYGILSSQIAEKVKKHTAVDIIHPTKAGKSETVVLDLNSRFSERLPKKHYDLCLALDVIEHLDSPEDFLSQVFDILKVNGKLYISTANIGYLPVRFSLLLGQFNYGKRGILDMTHKRLFTIKNFKNLIPQYGFKIDKITGFAPPIMDLVSSKGVYVFIEKIHIFLSRIMPSVFGYNFLVEATRMESIDDILEKTLR